MSKAKFNVNDLFLKSAPATAPMSDTISQDNKTIAPVPKKVSKPQHNKVKMNLCLNEDTVNRVKTYVERTDTKLGAVIDRAIVEYLERYGL